MVTQLNNEKHNDHCGSPSEVFNAFLRLGVTSFGGPIAHIGYFRNSLVTQRRWVSEERYGELLSICQFLPGPTSSQLAFVLGLLRAGWLGALAAFFAFTLPSVLLLIGFAYVTPSIAHPLGLAAMHGLKLTAVCVVTQAVVGMAQTFLTKPSLWLLAIGSAVAILVINTAWAQLLVIAGGAAIALLMNPKRVITKPHPLQLPYGKSTALGLLVGFILLLLFALLISSDHSLINVTAGFYRAGALVFGGGHVVLPLLEDTVVNQGLVSAHDFITGYGAAQVVPGPMFSLAAYLGIKASGVVGAITSVMAIFLPGFLLVTAVLPFWSVVAAHRIASPLMSGANAAVVGILAAALYDPVCVTTIVNVTDVVIAIVGAWLLLSLRLNTLSVIAWCVASSMLTAYVGW